MSDLLILPDMYSLNSSSYRLRLWLIDDYTWPVLFELLLVQTKALIAWLIDWLIDWLYLTMTCTVQFKLLRVQTKALINWLIDWLIDWLIYWLINWLIDYTWHVLYSLNYSVYRLRLWLIDWLIDWVIYWLYLTCIVWTPSRTD